MTTYYVGIDGKVTKNKKKKPKYIVDSKGNLTRNDDDIAPVKERTWYQKIGDYGKSLLDKDDEEESTLGGDIAPVAEKDDKKLDFFQKGAFEDGYQFGDAHKTALSTVGDIGLGVIKGVSSLVEGVTDLGLYGVSGLSNKVGAETFADKVKKKAQENSVEKFFKPMDDMLDSSILGRTSDAITQGIGQVGGIILTGGLGASAGLGAGAVTALTTGVMGTSSAGSGMSEAYNDGATDKEATIYGISKGVIDAGTELLFGGLGKAVGAIGLSKGISNLDDVFARKVSSKISNQVAKNFVQFGVKASAEGFEEVLAGLGTAVAKKLTYMDDEKLGQIVEDENLLEQFVVGSVTSGMIQSGYIPGTKEGSLKEANETGKDFIPETTSDNTLSDSLTENERKVVDKELESRIKEAEEEGKKLTKKDKAKLEEAVLLDLQKGNIDTDTIEGVLGGETYNSYNSIVEQENTLREEIERLQNDPRPQAQTRLEEAKAELETIEKGTEKTELKDRLSLEVQELTKTDLLSESYNEKARRSQAFEADLTKYDEKAQETVKKAVESGILNNTNRTHDFVDMIAKLSAEKGVLFDFTNNENLKKSGFALEGVTVNGLVSGKDVILNIDSSKALNTVVGHEITHVLEGTDLYDKLQTAVIEYSKTKGEYDSRLQAVTKLYKNVENADINKELTSDLVGDYLFTDSDFINNLSTSQPNVFKKIYEEIKYLYKLATAGSKEARQLEKVKKAFDKAYKETTANTAINDVTLKEAVLSPDTGNVSYAGDSTASTDIVLQNTNNASESKELTKEQQEYFKDSVVRDENGNLKPMYHGTSKGGHTVFDPYGASKYGLFGVGSYFTDNKSVAESYTEKGKGNNKQIYETYLNITNPIDMDAQANPEAWKKAFPEADFPESGTNENFYRAMEEYLSDNEYSKIEASETALDVLESMGHDGITHIGGGRFNKADDTRHQVYIAFHPEQIKNIDNTSPTTDADIRYSLSEDGEIDKAYIDAVRNEDTETAQKIVDEVAKNAGYTIRSYHGTLAKDFTEFKKEYIGSRFSYDDKGFFFIDNKEIAEDYSTNADYSVKGRVLDVYLKVEKPLIVDEQFVLAEGLGNVFKQSDVVDVWDNYSDFFKEEADNRKADGIILDDGTSKMTVVFSPRQIKSADVVTYDNYGNVIPISRRFGYRADMRYQLSGDNQNVAPIGNYNVYGKDIGLQTHENAQKHTQTHENTPFADDYAPLTEAEANERDAMQSDRLYSLNENDMPDEVEAPIYEETVGPTEAESPFDEKDIQDVGDRKQKAYMYENPEVKPYFQEEARIMLGELRNSVKGEKHFNDQLYYDTNGEQGWFGTKRETSEQIAYMLDRFKYTYADIEKGLNAIIEDHGAENNAISKRLEFMLDERLRDGYTDFVSGYEIPSNQDYINLLNEKQISEYSDEAYNRYLESLALAEAPAVEDIAPTKEYEAIEPRPENLDTLEAQWAKNKMSRVDSKKSEQEQIAKVLDAEPVTESDRNSRKWAIFKANVLDKGAVFEDLALKTKNRDLMGKWNYTLYSESRAQRLMGNGDAEAGVKPLNDIRAEVENTGLTKQFYEYMYHKHNVDRMKLEERFSTEENEVKNKPVFGYSVTAEMSQEIVDQYEFAQPEFMDYAKDVYSYQNYLRQQLVDNGVISQETADLWGEMYPHYVPIRRIDDSNANKIDVPLDTGRTSVNAPIKKATGGNTDILPLFDTMALRTLQTYKATAKNSFGVELKNTLGTTVENANTNVDEVIDSIDTQESLLQEGKNGRKPTFTVFENGERITFEITDDMYDAFKPISDSSMLSKTVKPLNVASNFHRGLLTEYNPVFILTNGIKDIQDVLINSQHAVRTYAKMPEAFAQLTTKGYWYNEYMNNGGDSNSYFDSDTGTFKTENKGLAKILDIPPLSTISKLNNYVEMIPRLAEYIASREAGRSIEVSMLDSARVTTNFRAGGDFTKFLNRNGATFLNASVQGAMQQVRNVREAKANGLKGWANLATKFAVAGLPAYLLNALLWADDDEYEELSDYVKQNYYIVGKYDDGKFIRIPKGRTVAVIQDAMKQISDVSTGNDEADLKSFLQLVVTNLAPANPIENNILAPIIQVKNNETWYGDELVPTRLADLPASEQYDESTDSVSKWLGEKLDISPVKINYLLDQYSGGVGDVVLPMLTPEAESGDNSVAGNIIAPLKKKFTVDSVMNNQNVSDFYETSEELTTNAKMSTATDEDVLQNKYINSIKAEMSDLYKRKRELQNSDLTDAEKYERVREIQSQIVELSKEALKSHKGVDISGDYATVGDRHYKRNESGEWTKLTDKQLEKQEEVTGGLGISASDYWGNKDEYDYAYEKPEKYAMTKALGGYDTYKAYTSELYDIKADKDESGKSISGSRKEKVLNYVNGLDADYGEKIILFKSEYPADDTYNQDIIEYLNNREDINYSEMALILKELGFTVDTDGNIYW